MMDSQSRKLLKATEKYFYADEPLRSIGIFCEYRKKNLVPPSEVMDEIADRFIKILKDYENANFEKKKISDYFELTQKRFVNMFQGLHIEEAILDIQKLHSWFDIPIPVANSIICLRLDSVFNSPDNPFCDSKKKGEETIRQLYYKFKDRLMEDIEEPTDETRLDKARSFGENRRNSP